MSGLKLDFKIDFEESRTRVPNPPKQKEGRIPRVTRIVALAILLQDQIEDGRLENYTQIAIAGDVTTTRVTQIMNHLLLAPDIMEEILFLPRVSSGKDPIPERALRPHIKNPDWSTQRILWLRLKKLAGLPLLKK